MTTKLVIAINGKDVQDESTMRLEVERIAPDFVAVRVLEMVAQEDRSGWDILASMVYEVEAIDNLKSELYGICKDDS